MKLLGEGPASAGGRQLDLFSIFSEWRCRHSYNPRGPSWIPENDRNPTAGSRRQYTPKAPCISYKNFVKSSGGTTWYALAITWGPKLWRRCGGTGLASLM